MAALTPSLDSRSLTPSHDDNDAALVTELLGRVPRGAYDVVLRAPDGSPLVLRNEPLLADGTPMPTRWWLVGKREREAVSRLESAGGVRAAEAAVDPVALADAHARYASERDAALPPGCSTRRPTGGVGGTRRGVKCLHAHYAWYLVGGDDPVGRWVAARLADATNARPAGQSTDELAAQSDDRPAGRPVACRAPEPRAR